MDLLKSCSKAEVYDSTNTLLCEAVVTMASYENYRLVVPIEFEPAEGPELYRVVFFDAYSGLIHCDCFLNDPLNISKEQKSLLCIIKEVKNIDQRRQDLKIPAAVSIEVNCVRLPAGEKRPPARIPAVTRNISAGGVYIVCDYPLPEGAQIQFQLHEMAKPLQVTAVVLRREELPHEKNEAPQFGHGCRHMEMKPHAEAELRSYIFRKELQLRQRRRRE